MINTKASKRYASALFDISLEKGNLDVILKDFQLIKDTIGISREFENVLLSPIINYSKKNAIFLEIFGDKLDKLTYEFMKLIISKKRDAMTSQIIEEFIVLYNQHNNLIPVEIITAVELVDESKNSINSKISTYLNKTIIPNFKVNKNLKGGIKIQVDDWVFDASIKSKLEGIRESLISN